VLGVAALNARQHDTARRTVTTLVLDGCGIAST